MPQLATTPAELTAANVASSAIQSVGFFAGPALGGIVLAVAGPPAAIVVTAGLVLWSAALTSRIRRVPAAAAGFDAQAIVDELGGGFRCDPPRPDADAARRPSDRDDARRRRARGLRRRDLARDDRARQRRRRLPERGLRRRRARRRARLDPARGHSAAEHPVRRRRAALGRPDRTSRGREHARRGDRPPRPRRARQHVLRRRRDDARPAGRARRGPLPSLRRHAVVVARRDRRGCRDRTGADLGDRDPPALSWPRGSSCRRSSCSSAGGSCTSMRRRPPRSARGSSCCRACPCSRRCPRSRSSSSRCVSSRSSSAPGTWSFARASPAIASSPSPPGRSR